jgi:hypothetical protein
MTISKNRHQLEKDKFVERADGQTAVAVDLSAGSEITVDANSVDSYGLVGKSSGGDFATAYASATTIDCTSLPSYHSTLIADDIVSIVQVATGGGVTATYHRDDAVMTVATNTITVTGATFAATDTFIVYTNIAREVTLAANSGTDIGDVDVTSLPGSVDGPGAPTIDSISQVAINLTTGADQVLVSSAASKQIWVYGYTYTCGDADGQTVSFQDEDDTALTGIMEHVQYGGASVSPSGNFAMPIWKLATDKDLEVDITGGDVDGWLTYAIISV